MTAIPYVRNTIRTLFVQPSMISEGSHLSGLRSQKKRATSAVMKIFRICRRIHAADAFSGEGARRFGGRWNTRGLPMVYTSTSLSLAALELFVHLDPTLAPDDLVSISATLPAGEPARTLKLADLPGDWFADETVTRDLGDQWITGLSSLALQVPSVPIHSESNVLINPLHPRLAELQIDSPLPFLFDARMFQRSST
jgi:RES domain-containing protein